MAFGLSTQHGDQFATGSLTPEQVYCIAFRVAIDHQWNIAFMSATGFIAYVTSRGTPSEEIRVKFSDGAVDVQSKSLGGKLYDFGKNKKNVAIFMNQFNASIGLYDIEQAADQYQEFTTKFAPPEEDVLSNPHLEHDNGPSGFLSYFQPREGYFITPIIIIANVAVFLIMVLSGVDLTSPTTGDLMDWGAQFRPSVLEGQWWRLFTCCFVHIGLFHLAMNMYALTYIGLLLEPLLGKSRFLSAYLLTGIGGSIASMWWNDFTVSAGASGAIFGMYGLFLAMLTTNLIDKTARKSLMTSIGTFVMFNLLIGTSAGIDNAGHIGGLIAGLIIGYAYYPSLRMTQMKQLKTLTIAATAVVILGTTWSILMNSTPSDLNQYQTEIEQFSELEQQALLLFNMSDADTQESFIEVAQQGIENWEESKALITRLDALVLPDYFHERNTLLLRYADLRLESYKLIKKSLEENSDAYSEEVQSYNKQIEATLNELNDI